MIHGVNTASPPLTPRWSATRRRCLQVAGAGAASLALPGLDGARAQPQPQPAGSGREIRIGQTLSLMEGRHAQAVDLLTGLKAALAQANAKGGVRGQAVSLRTLDDFNEPERAAANVQQMLDSGAVAIVAPLGRAIARATMAPSAAASAALIGPVSGDATLRRPHRPLVFPVRADLLAEWRRLLEHARRQGLQRTALFHAATALGEQQAREFAGLAAELGLPAPAWLRYDSDGAGVDSAATALRGSNSQLVVNDGAAPLYEDLIRKVRSRAPGATGAPQFWAVGADAQPLVKALGPLAEGMLVSQTLPNARTGRLAVVRDYQRAMREGDANWPLSDAGLEGYVVAQVLLAALRRAPRPDRAGLLQGLSGLDLDLGGLRLRYRTGDHIGLAHVDLALVGRDGRLVV